MKDAHCVKMPSSYSFPQFVEFIGATNDELSSPLLVTELSQGIKLTKIAGAVIPFHRDIAGALNFLHQKKRRYIIHSDISSSNLFVWRQADQWRVKVSD